MAFPFTQLLANSLIIGSIYALVAVGFSLIYATNRFVHFAHGTSVAAAAYAGFWLASILKLPFWLAVIGTLIFAGGLGAVLYLGVYRPLQRKNASNVILLIASVGLLLLIENLILLLFGADVKSFRVYTSPKIFHILGASITSVQLLIVAVALVLLFLLWVLMRKTILGKRMRAVADNKELARIMGIDAEKVALASFILGSLLAGIAGILVGIEQNLEPTMGTQLMIKGFTGSVIGGVTSVPGAVLGSFILGIAENFGIWWLPSGFKDAIAFGILFVFLIWRPTGLLGINKGVRE